MPNAPVKKFRLYPIEVAIWRFEDEETGHPRFSIQVNKSVKDKDTNKYIKKDFLYPNELASVSVLSAQALGWIAEQSTTVVKEEIKAEDAF
jgi:hypothetical protein